jgi:hypothetical protein
MTSLRQQLVADPLTGVVEGIDAQTGHVPADPVMDVGRLGRRCGDQVVDHDHGLVRLEHIAHTGVHQQVEHLGGEDVVHQSQIDVGNDELARSHSITPRCPGQDALGQRHTRRSRPLHQPAPRLRPPQT